MTVKCCIKTEERCLSDFRGYIEAVKVYIHDFSPKICSCSVA